MHLGHYNPDKMIEGSPPNILREWMEYSRLEPFGEERGDIRNAMLLQFLSNALGSKRKTKLSDFMPQFNSQEDVKKQNITPEAQEKLLRKYFK